MSNKYLSKVGVFIRDKIGWKTGTAFIVGFILGMFAGVKTADAATLSYTAPTTYTDGSPLPASAITGYEFRCGAGTTAGVVCTPLSLPGTATGGTMAITGPGTGFTACVEGATRVATVAGQSYPVPPWSGPGLGAYSAPVCKTFPPLQPNPPGNVTIAVVIGINMAPVYKLTSTGKRSADPAGFVALDLPCSGNVRFTYRGHSYRAVDAAAVKWWGDIVPSTNIAAPCRERITG